MAYRVRFRAFFAKPFFSKEHSLQFSVANRSVRVRPQRDDEALDQSNWVLFVCGGFDSYDEAAAFGQRLKIQVEVAALCNRIGVNVGNDRATSSVDEDYARSIGLIKGNERVEGNVHGVIVIPDDGLTRFPIISAEGKVFANAENFITTLSELSEQSLIEIVEARSGIRTLNMAFMAQHPLAQLVLSISAIEALGQSETWSTRQKELLTSMAEGIERQGPEDQELQEIASALRRSLHRIGLRQGVLRVLDRLKLSHLRREWDRLYEARSGLFHGTSTMPQAEMHELAYSAITLSAKIILRLAESEGLQIPETAKKLYAGLAD